MVLKSFLITIQKQINNFKDKNKEWAMEEQNRLRLIDGLNRTKAQLKKNPYNERNLNRKNDLKYRLKQANGYKTYKTNDC